MIKIVFFLRVGYQAYSLFGLWSQCGSTGKTVELVFI